MRQNSITAQMGKNQCHKIESRAIKTLCGAIKSKLKKKQREGNNWDRNNINPIQFPSKRKHHQVTKTTSALWHIDVRGILSVLFPSFETPNRGLGILLCFSSHRNKDHTRTRLTRQGALKRRPAHGRGSRRRRWRWRPHRRHPRTRWPGAGWRGSRDQTRGCQAPGPGR